MKKFERGVSLLCWAYNEESSILEYLERASQLMDLTIEDYEVVLIDDGSTDRTYEIAKTFQQKNQRLKIFKNEKNLNVGISALRAIQHATKEFLFWQTVDWSYDISKLRVFLEYLRRYDIVQGVRRRPVQVRVKAFKPFVGALKLFGIKHLTRRSDTIGKAIVSVINFIIIRTLFGVPLSDFQNVTFFPTKWVQSITFESKTSFLSPEALIKSYWHGMSMKEVPINFLARNKGEAKGARAGAILNSVKDIFRLWFRWVVLGKRGLIKKGEIIKLNPSEWE